ncbi:MAG: DUF401 family protein [Bacillota bacterium]
MALAGVLLALVVIIILVNRKSDTGLALLVGACIVGLFSPESAPAKLEAAWQALSAADTLELAAIIGLVLCTGTLLKASGAMDRLMAALEGVFGDGRMVMAVTPAVISLLTVPGGAILAAPMIGRVGEELGVPPQHPAASNLMFRHLFYPVYPLYTSLILAAGVSGAGLGGLILLGLPASLIGLSVSFYLYLAPFKPVPQGAEGRNRLQALAGVVVNLSPVLLAVALALGLRWRFSLALLTGCVWAFLLHLGPPHGPELRRRLRALLVRTPLTTLPLVAFGVAGLRSMVEGSGAVAATANHLVQVGVPVWFLAVTVPFLTGIATGSNLAALGISLPMLLPLFPPGQTLPLSYLVFMSTCIGYVVSPLHLCLILSRDYFGASIGRLYRMLAVPVAAVMITAVAVALLAAR